VPIITCRPWKPVDIKKIDPNTLSAIVNELFIYSDSWRAVKYIPKQIVIVRDISALYRFFDNNLWCLHVIVKPEVNKIAVFNNGTLIGSIILIPLGGHMHPSSILGDKLLWKNAQKNAKKKQISLIINNSIPSRRFFWTYDVCLPIYVASRTMSRDHCNIDINIKIIPISNSFMVL